MSDYAMVRLSRTMSIRSTCVCALCFMFFTCLTANGFNLNLRHALVFSDPTRQVGSYFGFTVALRKHEIRRWLVVGAPRGNSTYPEHRGIYQPGVVYQCRLDKGSFCQHLVLDSGGNREVSGYDGSPVQHKRDDSWLGGAIAVQDNGERLLVCAPRWRNSYYSVTENHYLMNGACYLTDGEIFLESKKETLLPLSEIGKQIPGNHYMYVFGQAGFSAHFPKNSTEFLLGAPGVFYWQGAIVRYRAPTFYGSGIRTEGSTDISDHLSTSSVPTYGYLGYSLSSGRFLSARSSHLYVAGSPRNDGSKGKVYVFDFPHTKDQDLQYIRVLDGTQMGEYFGGALCVVDLNGDNLDDLVVAAPQFSLQAANSDQIVGDEGRIYVFINYDDGKFMEITGDSMIMGSRRYGARFGTAVANVGDLNMDGYEDIAVGAPYEQNGVVYIYHGCADGIKHTPVQIVQAENIDPRIKGFGISLSKGLDIDENHYNDVAVGAFKSGHAVVLRSHPVITFKPTLTTSTRSVSHKMFKFSCTACLAYTGWHVPNTVDAKVTMQVDLSFGRANFVFKDFSKTNTYSYNTTLQRDTQWCKDLEVENAQRAVGRTEPLLLVMVYELVNVSNQISQRIPNGNATDEFCVECPVLDSTQPNTISTMVAFETGCKSVVCKPDLYIDARFIGIREKFIHGEKPTLQMKVEVKNKGEPAFLTRVTVVVPKATPIVEIPPICHELSNQDRAENYTLICDIGYPLEKNYTMDLLMSMRSVPIGTKKLVFAVNVTSVGNDVNPDDNHKEMVLPLGLQADMTITGVSSQDQIAHLNKEATYVEDLMLYHTFQVWNLGPSTVERAEIEFQIPHQYIFPTVQEIFMRILEPKLQASTRITCTPVMGFTYWNPSVDIPTSHPVLPDGEELGGEFNELINRRPLSVSKRSIAETESRQEETFVDSTSKTLVQDSTPPTSNFSLPPSNRTLFLNCTNPKVDCFIVKCSGGPFLPNKTRAVINFQLRPDLKILDSQLEMKDIILFSSLAKVTIREPPDTVQPEGHKPDRVDVHTMFFGKIPESTVATWIIVLAIITGVLLLLLITMALHKIGFFHRQKKEDLQALKEAEVPPSELEGRTNFQTEVISSDEL